MRGSFIIISSILLYKLVKFAVNKRFWHYKFPFTRNDRVLKMRFKSRFCYQGEAQVVNPAWDSHFYNNTVYRKLYSGKPWVKPIWHISITEWFFFKFLLFSRKQGSRALLSRKQASRAENRSHTVGAPSLPVVISFKKWGGLKLAHKNLLEMSFSLIS